MSLPHILVVDDDATIAEMLCVRLQQMGYEAESAGDTLQAGVRVGKRRPDLIVLDVAMPGGSGIDFYARLQTNALTADIPVIFVTAHPQQLMEKQVPPAPRVRFHVKPLNFDLFQAQIRELLGLTKAV